MNKRAPLSILAITLAPSVWLLKLFRDTAGPSDPWWTSLAYWSALMAFVTAAVAAAGAWMPERFRRRMRLSMAAATRAAGPRFMAVVAAALIATLFICVWVRRSILRTNQVKSIVAGRAIAGTLQQYREQHGRYPKRLDAMGPVPNLTDGWGGRWVYLSDGETYLLISFGRDGKPERTDYALLRRETRVVWTSICGQWDRDQIMSPLGMHQSCGK